MPTATSTLTTPTQQLTIAELQPDSAQANATINLAIIGTGFVDGAIVTFEGGQGQVSEVTAVDVINEMMILATVNVRADAAFGPQLWDVRVTNPDGSTAVLVDAFNVVPSG